MKPRQASTDLLITGIIIFDCAVKINNCFIKKATKIITDLPLSVQPNPNLLAQAQIAQVQIAQAQQQRIVQQAAAQQQQAQIQQQQAQIQQHMLQQQLITQQIARVSLYLAIEHLRGGGGGGGGQ